MNCLIRGTKIAYMQIEQQSYVIYKLSVIIDLNNELLSVIPCNYLI